MADEREPQSERSRDERFEDALDDLFGPDTNEPEPAQVTKASAPVAPSTAAKPPAAAEPLPIRPKRSIVRTAAIGCGVIVAVLFVCLAILLVIGLVAGEDTGSAALRLAAV
ncbi:MAG: hypothetical protein H0V47_05375 [Chloroflexia bacterium]|nr:hypothetical protein [Chloroflexia bacterium]